MQPARIWFSFLLCITLNGLRSCLCTAAVRAQLAMATLTLYSFLRHAGRSIPASSRLRIYLVHRFSLFHHMSRSCPRPCRKDRRRRNRLAWWTSHTEPAAAHPPRAAGHGGRTHSYVYSHEVDDWLGQRTVRPALGAALSEAFRLDGSGRAGRELHSDVARCARAQARRKPALVCPRHDRLL